ncbi:hypothetical protein BDL97_02G195900 [Sphagnum fallax]|nr:hypothetical protein BDL97_02G195900 [Sphagnum fallax]
MDDDPGFLPTNIFTPYKATEIAKDGCNQKISSPAQQPKSCSSFSSVDLRIEVHGMTIEFEDLERLTSVVTRSQQSSPNSCHQSSPPKIGACNELLSVDTVHNETAHMGEEHSEQFVHTEQGTAWTSEFQLSDDSKAEDDKNGGKAQVSSVLSSEQAPNVTLCEPNMLKTSVQVLTPDDWVADDKYVDFQEDALSSFQFQIMDIKILASSCANFYRVLVLQSQPSDKETHLSSRLSLKVSFENEKDVATVDMPIEQHGEAQHSSQGHDQVDPNLCGDIVLESAPSNSGVTPIKQRKQQRRPYDRKKQYINPLEAETRWQGGKRVSTRIKSKPLEWWKGERMLYGRVHACLLNPELKLANFKAECSNLGIVGQIDGVEALNNILLIGMTNRKDLLDEALLRPGRMEVQIEIGLPDEKGRFQILSIHSNKMKENSFLSADVDLKELAQFLLCDCFKQVSAADLSREIVEDNIKVTMDDFMSALNEVKPAFGAAINTLEMCRLNGMLDCGERHAHIQRTIMTFVEQVSFKVREHLCSLASLKDLVVVVRQHWQQLLELKVVFHSLKLLCFQCSIQSSTMLSMHFNGHFREHRRV